MDLSRFRIANVEELNDFVAATPLHDTVVCF